MRTFRCRSFLLYVVFVALILPVTSVSAACQYCDLRGGGFNYCTPGNYGYTRCQSTSIDCFLSGAQCAWARTNQAFELPPAEWSAAAQNEVGERIRVIPTPHSSGIDLIRAGVVQDANSGKIPDGEVRDAIMLLDVEPTDHPWADDMAAEVHRRFYKVNQREAGLSGLTVRCASTLCEIAVVQSIKDAERKEDNWQSHFFEVSRQSGFGNSLVESLMLMRKVDESRVAFFTYLLFDR